VAEKDSRTNGNGSSQKPPLVPRAIGSPEDYFPQPGRQRGLFEIGLVLGGTGSTGPYTAGVLDFLIEALDEWGKALAAEDKEKHDMPDEWRVPRHHVRLRIITGTSGGGICALLAARALHFRFPPAVDGVPRERLSANPFYDVWVNDIDITGLLRCSDLEGRPTPEVRALLDGQILQTIADNALRYPSEAQRDAGPVTVSPTRPYLTNPLPVIVTHTNLAGIPYRQAFTAASVNAEYFTNHADYVRIYFDYPGKANTPLERLIPDALHVYTPTGIPGPIESVTTTYAAGTSLAPSTPWDTLAQYALGTSAFPVGLPARTVARSAMHYAYRFAWDTGNGGYDWLIPDWSRLTPAAGLHAYSFTSIDGGCTDNEPIVLASQTLEGLGYSQRAHRSRIEAFPGTPEFEEELERREALPWHRKGASCAIVLVDPLCEIPADASADSSLALLGLLPLTAHMLVQANRFSTSQLSDFMHPAVFNRFLVAPRRTDPKAHENFKSGGDALCGAGLSAFMGFMHKDFRHHDFMLGRYNCQAFLTGTFTLDAKNLTFRGPRPSVPALYTGPRPPAKELPIIPLFGTAARPISEPEWPGPGRFKPRRLRRAVTRRAKLLIRSAAHVLPMNPVARGWLARKVSASVIKALRKELARQGL